MTEKEGTDNEMIRISGLTKVYGSKTAVDHLSLQVLKGEVFGLLGPNGAGKTTTILMLLGLTEPTEGSASIDGIDCTREAMKAKRIAGYLPDNVGFYPDMTGRTAWESRNDRSGRPEDRHLFPRYEAEARDRRCIVEGSESDHYG